MAPLLFGRFLLKLPPRSKGPHGTVGGQARCSWRSKEMQGRGWAHRELCQHAPGRGRRGQVCHVQLAGATLADDGDVSSRPAGKGESYQEDGGREQSSAPATKRPDVKINYRAYP